MIDIDNKFLAICDTLAFVNKLSWLLKDDYNNHGLHKSTEQELFHLILQILPKSFVIEHIKGHQNDSVLYNDLSIKDRLNIDANKLHLYILPCLHIIISNQQNLLYTLTTNTHIIKLIIRFELTQMLCKKMTSYAGSTLGIQQPLMTSTCKITHPAY